MLKYIKRQTSRRSQDDDAGNSNIVADADAVATAQKRHSLRSTTSFCDEVFLEQLAAAEEVAADRAPDAVSCGGGSLLNVGADEDIFKYNSRLSMTLAAIVSEPNCLSYFVQYLETRNALPLIKFYLDIENFKRAALTQLEREQQLAELEETDCTAAVSVDEAATAAALEEDNDVPELKTLCDLSMRKPLTDDEKSRIYAETNKQINKTNSQPPQTQLQRLKASSELSLCSALGEQSERAISAASIRDAIAIYQKYLIVNARQFVELPIGILAHISLLLCGKNGDELERSIPASCFDEAGEFVLQQLERDHVQGFLQSSYYCNYCVELIEGVQINMYDVLYSELALFYFTEYLEQQHERECLEFWIMAINFRKSFASLPPNAEQAKEDAMLIYARYFSLQCECRLWMSDKLRSRVEQAICAPGQLPYAFDLALLVTATYLEQKYFSDFLKSSTFANYVNELRAKQNATACSERAAVVGQGQHRLSLRKTPKLSQQRHRKTLSMSDCTTPISQHNTLLAAMDTAKPTANMNIDSRQLTNPQLLWQRPAGGGALKFGHVNALGRYERDFEAVDAVALKSAHWSLSASGNKIKNAMRKLVNLPEDHVQEEIAWQVAEMIVKDVTSVTLNGQAPTA